MAFPKADAKQNTENNIQNATQFRYSCVLGFAHQEANGKILMNHKPSNNVKQKTKRNRASKEIIHNFLETEGDTHSGDIFLRVRSTSNLGSTHTHTHDHIERHQARACIVHAMPTLHPRNRSWPL